ncbi:hypothetical protein [Terracoccus luteus]|jgi:hypothetical protein|uniref:Uncharacterized protein n=1 Tax=Terracoccus luteus TaxID=53356 RepID=A0A495Y4R0_9MICO|nr:hypothetical protein [Terracoccus luteus]MBB2987337.1 hypothetical protein [Terracoccus luteus]MCP2172988.1 hypothetical protein [Terracoccus luteus]RKT79738.1 hypothetical protein DFJ68_3216 [Terracoccus luteus]
MTNQPGPAPGDDLRFTVPVPPVSGSQSVSGSGSNRPAAQADPTQVIPLVEHTTPLPAVTASPMWGQAPAAGPAQGLGAAPGLGAVGRALLWITVGWWLFFVIRLTSLLAGGGSGSTAAYRTVEMYPAETVVVGVVAVVGAVLLWLARPVAPVAQRVFALALSVVTVVVVVWRFAPV